MDFKLSVLISLLNQPHAVKISKTHLTKKILNYFLGITGGDYLCACVFIVKGENILKLLDQEYKLYMRLSQIKAVYLPLYPLFHHQLLKH